MDNNYDIVEPLASSIVQSLRSIGYSLETAIADIVDNSIAANANQININFIWNKEISYISIQDNGMGMGEEELKVAMRIGSMSPLSTRNSKDLGRFGMGLKTAAFSQCKRLSVMTKKKDEELHTRCWDLDLIEKTGKWSLLKEFKEISDLQIIEQGTIVLLEKLDRLISESYSSVAYNSYLKKVASVEQHLSMVFHRFLEGPNAIQIYINNMLLKPWDPFLVNEMATQELAIEQHYDNDYIIKIQPYILPHHSKISKDTYSYADGPRGWHDQQGFYIYRNRRMLVSGSWLSIFRKEEPYKLARIMIDITSDMDFSWQIDIKKSTARPPKYILDELKRIGKIARDASYKVYYHRGVRLIQNNATQNNDHVWEQIHKHGKVFYKLNRAHPILLKLNDEVDDYKLLNAYLSFIEEYSPFNLVSYTPSLKIEDTNQEKKNYNKVEITEDILSSLKDIIYALKSSGYTGDQILYRLCNSEPFNKYFEQIKALLEEE
ncbi:ATP-binding protein [Ammoniphilus sp. CFH 90114]|uniref:ATP-binding protein n=1 Tax=Ammoniphilus sp. CFH 90114 TaxID=2493665 RepID=UPI0013E92CC4|nr:ATP-binding protein [Ammoniphilus sp. CFH 90114]